MGNSDGHPSIGRRKALRLGVGAGAGAVVWTEPTLQGLARRPAYAAGGSPVTAWVEPALGLQQLGHDGFPTFFDSPATGVRYQAVTELIGGGARRRFEISMPAEPTCTCLFTSGRVTLALGPPSPLIVLFDLDVVAGTSATAWSPTFGLGMFLWGVQFDGSTQGTC